MLTTRVLYNDYIGPARLRLNLPEVVPELKRVWHPYFRALAISCIDKISVTAF